MFIEKEWWMKTAKCVKKFRTTEETNISSVDPFEKNILAVKAISISFFVANDEQVFGFTCHNVAV